MAPRINYQTALGRARAHHIMCSKLDNSECDPNTSCWIFQGSKNSDGYGQIWAKKNSDIGLSGRSSQTAFLLHRISYLANTGRDAADHVSHLCNRPACFNPDHLVDETASENNARKGCAGPIICSVHFHIVVDLCQHEPRCIRGPRDDVNCCLAIRESDPAGWASDKLSRDASLMSLVGSEGASSLLNRPSSEYEGAEFLEEVLRAGEL
jgi:hypothetical protein